MGTKVPRAILLGMVVWVRDCQWLYTTSTGRCAYISTNSPCEQLIAIT